MQLFIDSADPQEIRQAFALGFVDGITTNPSLAAKTGKSYQEIVQEILEIIEPETSLSLEVTATNYESMLDQARRLAAIDDRVVVKLPCTSAGIQACRTLTEEDIRVNMTLVFSARQALLAAKAGAYYVSPFAGRLDDIEEDTGLKVIKEIIEVYSNYDYETQVLFASVRHPQHVEDAAKIGADIATIPFEVLKQLSEHKLTQLGLEKFLQDWEDSGLELPA